MYIHAIGIIIDNNSNIVGYRLIDLDDNNKVMDVNKSALINVLKSRKLRVTNLKLSNNSIAGVYYSTKILPRIDYNNTTIAEESKFIILDINTEDICTVCNVLGNVVRAQLKSVVSAYKNDIINIDETSKPLCRSIGTLDKDSVSNVENKLDLEVNNKTKVWDIQTFKKYMDSHGYKYRLERLNTSEYELYDIDPRCKYIHIPKEVAEVKYLFDNSINELDIQLETIIIPGDLRLFKKLFNNEENNKNRVNINNVYFQQPTHRKRTIDVEGLKNLNIHNIAEMPEAETIYNIYSMCYIAGELKLSRSTRELWSCFEHTLFKNTEIDMSKTMLQKISNCFTACNITSIKFNNYLEVIRRSFNSNCISELDFNTLCGLTELRDSFESNHTLRIINMQRCIKLKHLGEYCFANCLDLNEVVLPVYLESIGYNCFRHAKLQELNLPNTVKQILHPICSKETVIRCNSNSKLINNSLINGYTEDCSTISFENGYYALEDIRDNSLWILANKSNLSNIANRLYPKALKGISKKIVDTSILPLVEYLPEYLFEEALVEVLIINNNIKAIHKNILSKCNHIKEVYISSSVIKIDSTAFASIATNKNNTTIFNVVKDSYAHKYLLSKKFICRAYNTEEELFDDKARIDGKQANKNKFLMLLSGNDEYKVLLEDKYIDGVDILYSACSRLNKQGNNYGDDSELDTSKFVSISYKVYNGVRKSLDKILAVIEDDSDRLRINAINFVNLLTTIYDNNNNLYTDTFIDYCNNVGNLDIQEYLVLHCRIQVLVAKTSDNIRILIIVLDDNIVFQTPFVYSEIYKDFSKTHNGLIDESYTPNSRLKHVQYTITDLLKPGDTYGETVTVGNYTVPAKFKEKFIESFTTNFILIGVIDGTSRNSKNIDSIKSKNGNRYYNALYFDKIQAKFLEVKAQFNVQSHEYQGVSYTRFKETKRFTVIKVIDFCDFRSLDTDYFRNMRMTNNNLINNNQIKLSSMTKEEIDGLFNDKSQYDMTGNSVICKAAYIVYKEGISNKDLITSEVFELICKSGLLTPANISMNNCKKANMDCKLTHIGRAGDILIDYKERDNSKINNEVHYYGIINDKSSMSSKKLLFKSSIGINQLIKSLYIIGEYRFNKSTSGECKIHNNKIDIDKFDCLVTVTDENNNMLKYSIALDKANGDIYIIGEHEDMDFYKLFRFKRFDDAYKFLEYLYNSHRIAYINSVMSYVMYNGNYLHHNKLIDLRESIMMGYSNNYPYIGENQELFKMLAKQPIN